jgi:hypothetical protein
VKSSICTIQKGGLGLETILNEVEKVAAYNGLQKKEALRLRLLAEELTGMLPELVRDFDGSFWMQNDENKYALHVELLVDSLSKERKQALIAMSATRKNASASVPSVILICLLMDAWSASNRPRQRNCWPCASAAWAAR